MNHSTFWLTANDHTRLYVNQWLPQGPLQAVVMVSHGMAEHSGRYARLAEALCDAGYGVYALDQRAMDGPPMKALWGCSPSTMAGTKW